MIKTISGGAMRCKACNIPFADSDFTPKRRKDDGYCSYCRFVSDNPFVLSDREYQFESITEVPSYVENYYNTVGE